MKRKEEVDLKLTRAKEFLGLSALHGPLLLKLQHRRSEDPLDLLRHIPPGLVVLGLGCAARLHLSGTEGRGEGSLTLQFGTRALGDAVTRASRAQECTVAKRIFMGETCA